MHKMAISVISDGDELIAGCKSGDSDSLELSRSLLHGLIDISDGNQLALFLRVVVMCAEETARSKP